MTSDFHDAMSVAEVARQARQALAVGGGAAFVMQVPDQTIIAARPAAAELLDPGGGSIEGRRLDEFTSDEPSGALALFADGRINGYEAIRTLTRPGGDDVRVSLWHRRFEHQATSRYALVLITTDGLDATGPADLATALAPAMGAVSGTGTIEQISGGTTELFGKTPDQMVGTRISALVHAGDTEKWRDATADAAVGEHTLTVLVRARGSSDLQPGESIGIACDVLLLPLRPGFTFVFLPVIDHGGRPLDAAGIHTMLTDLSTIATLAHRERQKISGIRDQDIPGLDALTTREREMFARLVAGYRVSAIASDLVLSASTVRTHLASIFAKLGVSTQSELIGVVRSSHPSLGWSELYPSWHIDR